MYDFSPHVRCQCINIKTFFLRQRHWPRQRYRDRRRAKTFWIWSSRDETRL